MIIEIPEYHFNQCQTAEEIFNKRIQIEAKILNRLVDVLQKNINTMTYSVDLRQIKADPYLNMLKDSKEI